MLNGLSPLKLPTSRPTTTTTIMGATNAQMTGRPSVDNQQLQDKR